MSTTIQCYIVIRIYESYVNNYFSAHDRPPFNGLSVFNQNYLLLNISDKTGIFYRRFGISEFLTLFAYQMLKYSHDSTTYLNFNLNLILIFTR